VQIGGDKEGEGEKEDEEEGSETDSMVVSDSAPIEYDNEPDELNIAEEKMQLQVKRKKRRHCEPIIVQSE